MHRHRAFANIIIDVTCRMSISSEDDFGFALSLCDVSKRNAGEENDK